MIGVLRAAGACALVAAAGALAACGGTTKTVTVTTPVRILDTEKVERAIEQSILSQRHLRATVTCPSGVHQQKGLSFTCRATTAKTSASFIVTQKDAAGNVHYVAP